MSFPIDRRCERTYEPSWSGEVFVCDIDRTYLYTRFSSLKGLARIPFEFAIDKQDIEGMVPLLREIRRGPGTSSRQTPLYFISASPAQLRRVIERKMLLDGLEFDGTTFKDWKGVIAGLRLARLREQLGFKLTALMASRRDLPEAATEILVGDDLESDALAFTLYADLLSGRLSEDRVHRLLLLQGVAFDDASDIVARRRALHRPAGVKRALLRLERHAAAEAFLDYFPHLVACHGALQMALCLFDQGSISEAGVLRVAEDLRSRGWSGETVGERLRDAARRALVELERLTTLRGVLGREGLIPPGLELPPADETWVRAAARDAALPWTPERHLRG